MVLIEREADLDVKAISDYVSSLQVKSGPLKGGFRGDMWGEVDLRFSMCALSTLSLLKNLEAVDTEAATVFVKKCANGLDGGFGSRPGSESHAGLVYCALGSLSLLGRLDVVDADLIGHWLSERQLPSGGLNGRPEKLPDVCYSWWVSASLSILGRLHWIDKKGLRDFVLSSQDEEEGGFADRPGDCADPFHTNFGVAGLALLDDRVNPVLCMPNNSITRLGIKTQILI